MERTVETDRSVSFNPEATAFSPTMASIEADKAFIAASANDETAMFGASFSSFPTGYSPIQPDRSMHATSLKNGSLEPLSILIGNLLAHGIPVDVLTRAITEHPAMPFTDLMKSTDNSSLHYCYEQQQPMYSLSAQPSEPLNLVDIDELSAGLGLPSANKDSNPGEVPVSTRKSRPSQVTSETLYGKLIDRALSEPLTANVLARYMKSQSESSEETVKPFQHHQNPFLDHGITTNEQFHPVKLVHAPPGFGMQMPRTVTIDDVQIPRGPAIMQQMTTQANLSGYLGQNPTQPGTSTSFRRHRHNSSGRQRPRGYTHTKRTDQGPEPSAADIYPDDAHFTPKQQPLPENYFLPPAYIAPPRIVQLEDPASWPTPAEVFSNKIQATQSTPAHGPQLPPHRKPHVSPTTQDVQAADRAVHSLLHELPEPSINTLITLNAFDLLGDERSLSPDQRSGKRYGLNFYSVGLRDDWTPPRKEAWGQSTRYRNEPFRVRPRDHGGWGGWDWAVGMGWGTE